jgi:ribose transport system substrate-binding protein
MKLAFLRITRRRVSQLVALSVAVAVTASTAAVAGGVTSSQHAQKADAFSLAPFIAKVKAYQKPSTKWQGPTTPVTPPTTKFKVVGISCYSILHGCITPLVGAQHAAQALGWSMTILDGKGDPTVWAKDMDQAINSGANVIILGAVDGDLIKPQLAKAKAKGIIVVSTSNASAPGEQGFVLDTMVNMVTVGKMLADWMIVQTGGKGPNLPYWDKEYESNNILMSGMLSELKLCTTCKIYTPVSFVGTQVGTTLAPNVVARLRSHSDVKYISFTYDPALESVAPAIANAGMKNVHAVSELGDAVNLGFIASGKVQDADGAWDNEYEGWATIDQVLRIAAHQPLATTAGPARFKYGENIPYVLLTKRNLPPAGKDYVSSIPYVQEYKKLWGLA